jgi:hypothetical protein
MTNKTGLDVLDNGDISGFITKMHNAFGVDFQPLDATLTALAALTGAANKLPYFNGADTAALTDLTSVGRDILGKTTAAQVLSYLAGAPLDSAVLTGTPSAPTATLAQTLSLLPPHLYRRQLTFLRRPVHFPAGLSACLCITAAPSKR